MFKIPYIKLYEDAIEPTKGSEFAAGADLYAYLEKPSSVSADGKATVTIPPQTCLKIGTGIAVEIPDGYFGAVFARSGLATKDGLRPANCVGVIDSDYRGEIIVPLYNDSPEDKVITHGERIAQLVIIPYANVGYERVRYLSGTERGSGGFGSTGA